MHTYAPTMACTHAHAQAQLQAAQAAIAQTAQQPAQQQVQQENAALARRGEVRTPAGNQEEECAPTSLESWIKQAMAAAMQQGQTEEQAYATVQVGVLYQLQELKIRRALFPEQYNSVLSRQSRSKKFTPIYTL